MNDLGSGLTFTNHNENKKIVLISSFLAVPKYQNEKNGPHHFDWKKQISSFEFPFAINRAFRHFFSWHRSCSNSRSV